MIGTFETPATFRRPAINKAVVNFCIECAGGQWFVRSCFQKDCPLYPFRMGKGSITPAAINKACMVFCSKKGETCQDENCQIRPFRFPAQEGA